MALKWPDKDPDEILDYLVDWSARLAGDVISTSLWLVPTGIVRASDSHATATTTIWLTGGTLGKYYDLLNRIVTAGGRTMDQTIRLRIVTK